ncbi:MAG: alkylmercury lyase family protein [Hyphomonadaceae bacterium]|nr:alkylmercury lyase family protein [Hyphomonadaceae bacterium]
MNDCCASSPAPDKATVSTDATLPSYIMRPGVTFPDWSVVTSPTVRDALQTMVSSGHVLERWSGYEAAADRVRVALLQLYVELGQAPTTDVLAQRAGLSEESVRPLLKELRRRDLAILDGDTITGAYPFTERDTGHRVTLDARTLKAMCAVDALGVGDMTGRDIAVESRCRHCGTPVKITTQDRGRALADIAPDTAVAWLSVRYEDGCAASSLCTATSFFCSDDHLAAWRHAQPADKTGYRLTIEEALEAGRAIFAPSLAGVGAIAGHDDDGTKTRDRAESGN